jgi:hypothetical protein
MSFKQLADETLT